ncbi:MAG: hypothetical protein U1E63_07225 [Burkholderiales bacterium]
MGARHRCHGQAAVHGKQEGALIGYNPHKPGRPSHAYHSYQMAGLRLMLSVSVAARNQSHANTTLPGPDRVARTLAKEKRPALVRGDCGRAASRRWRRWKHARCTTCSNCA